MKKFFATILIVCAISVLILNLNATTINIDKNSEGGLVSAINQATDGDTIHISSGTYTGENFTNLVIDKKIAIEGDKVILDGEGKNNIFKVKENGSLTLTNITIANAHSNYGAGVYNEGYNLSIFSCKFINNSVDIIGGAIYNTQSDNLKITDSEFISNKANGGGAIYNDGRDVIVVNCNFTANQGNGAGAIYNYYSRNCTILKSNFINNIGFGSYSCGGAISNEVSSDMLINQSTFINNTASFSGGAIYNYYGDRFKVFNSKFVNNSAYDSGSAIYSDLSYYGEIFNSIFSNNSILPFDERIDDIGVIFIRGSGQIGNSTIKDNNPNDIIYEEL
ncbi:MAG: hypothetical protein LBT10_02420 [Methanobrevibacter sp.]|jgi:predicted outer membrane repeat protein|nr:hypothetical protein [Methanobrevibacter sp.]